MHSRRTWITVLWIAAGMLCAPVEGAQAPARPEIHLYVFLSPDCPTCEPVKKENLQKTAAGLGCDIVPRYFDVEDMANYRILIALEHRFRDADNDLPVVVVGDRLLGGVDEVKASLPALLSKYASAGGVAAVAIPDDEEIRKAVSIPSLKAPVHAVFFDRPGCRACGRAGHILAHYQGELGRAEDGSEFFAVERVIAADRAQRLWHEVLSERARLGEDRRLVAPAVFVGGDALIDRGVTDSAIAGLLLKHRLGEPAPAAATEQELSAATARLNARFASLGLAAVLAGGLIDGINPCAFVTLIFLVGYLAASGRKGTDILLVGLAFTTAVFLAYFTIGIGLAAAVHGLKALPQVSRVFTWCLAAMAFVLAAASAWDMVAALRGRGGDVKLGLPGFLRRRVSLTLAREFRTRTVVLAALVSGFLISFLELVCTGQIYLPLIQVMMSFSASRVRALQFLLLYNLAFIVPLVVTFAAVYAGFTSQQLTAVLQRHLALSKALALLLFAGMGVLLVILG